MSKTVYLTALCSPLFVLLLVSQYALTAEPINHATALMPFVNDDTFAVVYVDIASLDLPKDPGVFFNPIMLRAFSQMPQEKQSELLGLAMANDLAVRLRNAGGQGF